MSPGNEPGLTDAGAPLEDRRALIGFAKMPGRAEEAFIQKIGGRIRHTYHLVPAIAATIPEAAIKGLLKNPLVTRIEPDGVVHAIDELANTWGVKRTGAGEVHAKGNKARGVAVAVLDSGTDCGHPELYPNCAGGYDFVNKDPYPDDDHHHGTHVSGTVAAMADGFGVLGVAPEVSLYSLKVLDASGSGNWSDIIAALQWAVDHGMQVTNNSYGSNSNPGAIVQDAFAAAYAAGLVNVAAAGNGGNCGGRSESVTWPAKYASVIAVAATDQRDARPCFSSTGTEVELAAPGVNINSTFPGGGYALLSGTSMASPHVAGAAALVIAAGVIDGNGNGFINDEVRQILISTAEDLGAPGRDSLYGHGLIDAAAAYQVALAASSPPEPAINILLATDKTDYLTGIDSVAVLTATVSDEQGNPVTGLAAAAFSPSVDGLGASAIFAETAMAGVYEAKLDISSLANGSHTVAITVADARATSGTGSAQFSIGPAYMEATHATVSSLAYTMAGGKNAKDLLITVYITDNLGNSISGGNVSISIYLQGAFLTSASGVTDANGSAIFKYKNAPAGCYSTMVMDVAAGGLAWDGITPENLICK